MGRIFISYSRIDSEVTYEIARSLRMHGYTVWTDISAIQGGSVWQSEIEEAIYQCDVILVVVSSAAKSSRWVACEILFALDLEKTVIPLLIEDIRLPIALYSIQPIHYITEREVGFSKLLAAIPEVSLITPLESSNQQKRASNSETSLLGFRANLLTF